MTIPSDVASMTPTVRVRIRRATRISTCVVRDIALSRCDLCVVRSERGLEHAVCIASPEECAEVADPQGLPTVVRKANAKDAASLRYLQEEEQKAKAVCARKIEEHHLPMKLVDAEYTFDRHKIVFYFTAEERVDFRDLVRDLARELHARIELRHIQVRDQAKLVGGLAPCGRELCCATWLRDFMPISMKMAKRQNLSLNPSKISGQCGRLMCCLSYENDQYAARRKKPARRPQAAAEAIGPDADAADVTEQEDAAAIAKDLGHGETVFVAGPGPQPQPDHESSEAEETPVLEITTADARSKEKAAGQSEEAGKPRSRRRKPRRRRRHRHKPSQAEGTARAKPDA